MKIWGTKTEHTEEEERSAAEPVRNLLAASLPHEPADQDPYWQTLLAETNRRLDGVASGRAISISWAARVAIPGVVAIIFFFIGLHYYAPKEPVQTSLSDAVFSIPVPVQDSLILEAVLEDGRVGGNGLTTSLFDLRTDDIEEYLIVQGATGDLLETYSAEEMQEVVGLLSGSM